MKNDSDHKNQPSYEATYHEGRKHGVEKAWYKNGKVKRIVTWHHGQKQGVATAWYENGKIKYEILYHKGARHGVAKRWHKDGKPQKYGYWK